VPEPPARDEDLVRRYLSGDRAAFAALVERHERRVYNLALRMTGREEDARDAAQDAFLTVLRKLSSFRGEAAFTTWLHRVTVNACYDLLRKRQRAPLLERGEDDLPALEPPPAPDHADASSLSMDVQRALLQVPEDFRAVMILHDVHDLRQEEVAAIVGVPIGTVKSRLHRGRIALARAIGIEREEPVAEDPAGPAVSGGSSGAAPGAPSSGERADATGPSEGTVSP
jgi:RNA polymerase sigma-70 factor, ECF subfamily